MQGFLECWRPKGQCQGGGAQEGIAQLRCCPKRVAFPALVFINCHPQVSKSDEASCDGSRVGRFACYPGCAVWLRDGRLAGQGCTRSVSHGGIGSVGRPGRSGGRVGWSAWLDGLQQICPPLLPRGAARPRPGRWYNAGRWYNTTMSTRNSRVVAIVGRGRLPTGGGRGRSATALSPLRLPPDHPRSCSGRLRPRGGAPLAGEGAPPQHGLNPLTRCALVPAGAEQLAARGFPPTGCR